MRNHIKHLVFLLVSVLALIVAISGLIGLQPKAKMAMWLPVAIAISVSAICIIIIITLGFFLLLKRGYALWKSSPTVIKATSVAFVTGGLLILEISLRHLGMQPGFTCQIADQQKILPLDSLIDYHLFIGDSFGVTKFNPVADGSRFLHPYYVNAQGFHSHHSFTQPTIDSCKKAGLSTLALIGDSYTYGGDADSGKAFADLLEQTGKYAVFNFGIPGTSPVQYEAIVKEYIVSQAMHFDKVVIVFCGANDIEGLEQEKVTPLVPLMFNTNAGNLYGNTGNKPATTARQAYYDNVYSKYTVTGLLGDNFISTMLSKSVVASQLTGRFLSAYYVLVTIPALFYNTTFYTGIVSGLITHDNDKISLSAARIRKDCAVVKTNVQFFLVPGREMIETQKTPAFNGIKSIDAAKFTLQDYHQYGGNAHPVNSGHYKIFIQMESLLNQ